MEKSFSDWNFFDNAHDCANCNFAWFKFRCKMGHAGWSHRSERTTVNSEGKNHLVKANYTGFDKPRTGQRNEVLNSNSDFDRPAIFIHEM